MSMSRNDAKRYFEDLLGLQIDKALIGGRSGFMKA
jgi:hypothetical protein